MSGAARADRGGGIVRVYVDWDIAIKFRAFGITLGRWTDTGTALLGTARGQIDVVPGWQVAYDSHGVRVAVRLRASGGQ